MNRQVPAAPVGPNARPGGFSLVELLVAMTLGLLMIGGMIGVFAANKRSTELNEATANMQENARFAMNAISADIRMAGHQGCAPLDGAAMTVQAVDVPMTSVTSGLYRTAVTGYEVESATEWTPTPALGTGTTGFSLPTGQTAVPGTHALSMQFGEPATADLAAGMTGPSGPIVADGQLDLRVGDHAIVSNCFGADLFEVTGSVHDVAAVRTTIQHGAGPNKSANLTEAYGSSATLEQTRVMRFASNVYYVVDTGLRNSSGDAITALYQQSLPYNDASNPPTELIRGVENLRLSLGVRNSLGQLSYVEPDSGYDPARVRAVRVGLLLSSWERIAQQDDAATYMLAGQAIAPSDEATAGVRGTTHPGDRRHRLAFNTTVKVRNYR